MFLFVAVMMRALTLICALSPIRSNSLSWSTRKSFVCVDAGRSPTSSKKIVPWPAASKRPWRARIAPVNAPLSWPKSSLSIRDSGRAAQTHLYERLVRAVRAVMDGLRDPLFAHAALAQKQHGGVRAAHLLNQGVNALHRLRAADDGIHPVPGPELVLEALVLLRARGQAPPRRAGAGGQPGRWWRQ